MIKIPKSNTHPAFVYSSVDIGAAIRAMITHRYSSALVCNHDDVVVGIFTERDILRKLAILDVENKLGHSIATVMTRKILFARKSHLDEDVRKLHFDHHIRHFPIVESIKPVIHRRDVVAYLTVTDLSRQFLELVLP